MTSKWKIADERKLESSEDLEDSMSKELADLGMLEQGMTFQDKRDLLSVVRLSQKSAKVEEEERKTKTWSPRLQSNRLNPSISSSSKEREQDNAGELKDVEIDCDERNINQKGLSKLSMALSDDKREEKSLSTDEKYCVSSQEYYFGGNNTSVLDSTTDMKVKLLQGNSPNSAITLSSKDSEIESVSGDTGVLQNGCEKVNDVQLKEHPSSDNDSEIFPSVKIKQKDLSDAKREKDDRERNIDVFSHSSETDRSNFLRRSINKNQDRIPFYFVPKGMSLRKYIAYFKCCVNQYYKNLAIFQRRNIEHLEWGTPITMAMSSGFTGFRSKNVDASGDSSSKRYNFRDRYPKPKLVDFTSENSEEGEEESNDEDNFTPHHKKLPGIKLSTKRKNTSTSDSMSTKKEKKESPQKKVQEDESLEDDEPDDNQVGDPNDKANSKSKSSTSSRKRARKSKIPRLQSKVLQTQSDAPEEVTEMDSGVSISSIMEPDIVIAEGPTVVSTQPQLDDLTNQPSPLSVKQRRIQLRMKNNGRNRRKSEPRKNPDVVVVDEEIKAPPEEFVERVPCPICWQMFPATDIEEHASECNQYNPDHSSSSVKV